MSARFIRNPIHGPFIPHETRSWEGHLSVILVLLASNSRQPDDWSVMYSPHSVQIKMIKLSSVVLLTW